MKNIRKIVAILAAVVMLCSVLPMGVFAAPGDVIVDINFDDGTNGGFARSYNENGYIVFDATTNNYENTYNYLGGFQTNVDYVVTFKAKANKDTTLNFKINDNWGADAAAFTVNVTTEWQEFEGTINMASLTSAIVMFSSNDMAANAATYYIDDLKIVEKAPELEVGVVTNGDFSNGDEGWKLDSSASIVDGALQLTNTGVWAEAAMQDIAVEVGTEYTLSWQSKRISGSGAYMMFILKGDNSNHAAVGQNWMNETSGNWVENSLKFTAEEALLKIKVSCQDANAGVILIDDIKLTATPKPVAGQIANGDFETGDATGWSTWQSTVISADAAHTGSYGANIIGNGGWGGFLDQTFLVEDGKTYEFSFWYKVNTSGFNWSLKGNQSGAIYGSGWETTNSWTQVTKTFIANGDTNIFLNFNGGGNGAPENAYIDDVKLTELKDPSDDGFIKNGDFETGKTAPWNTYGTQTAVCAEAAHSGDYGLKMIGDGGWGGTGDQNFTTEAGKTYEVTVWIKTVSYGVNIQIQDNGATVASAWVNNATDWTEKTFEYTATSAYGKINFCGGGDGLPTTVYVDDIKVKEKIDPSFDGYITNGDFETGELFPWQRIWDSQVDASIVEGGLDSNYAAAVSAKDGKLWGQLRQKITVEPNTNYIATVWAKNSDGMSLLVKDGADTYDIKNAGANAGDEWTLITNEFNSGDNTSVLVGVMCNTETASGIFDNLSVTLAPTCEHEYFYACDAHCMNCGELTRPEASHTIAHVEAVAPTCDALGNIEFWYCEACGAAWLDEACTLNTNMMAVKLPAAHTYDNDCDNQCNVCEEFREAPHNLTTHVAAVVPANCQEYGHDEYWTCEDCGSAFMSNGMGGYYETNPAWIMYTGDHVRPEGSVPCAVVQCEICGEDAYGEPCDRGDAPVCQDAPCINCGEIVWGWGCNYNTGDEEVPLPLCQAGTCVYCGTEYEYLYDHENGAWAPCLDGECSYGCGLQYPATEDHIDDDADGWCDTCWSEMPTPSVIYGDANGDGAVNVRDVALLQQYLANWDVSLNEVSADANGDGAVNVRDVALLQQYLANWDVTLG